MSGDGSFEVNVLGAVLVVELAADKGVKLLVKGLHCLVQLLQVLLKRLRLVPGTPVIPGVGEP